MSPNHDTDRRQHPRVELFAQVQLTRQSEVHILSTMNVSRGGLFIQSNPKTLPEYKVGTEIEIVIFAPDNVSEDVRAKARIVRVEEGVLPGRTPGFGLRFTLLEKEDAQRLDRMMSSH